MSTSPVQPCVLIIDDDKETLELSRILVGKADANAVVVTACGAAEGLAYLSKVSHGVEETTLSPALVLLDVNMPGTSGFEVLEWVRKNRLLANVKVVMLSSSNAKNDIQRASELGADGYLIKNPTPPTLNYLLRRAYGIS